MKQRAGPGSVKPPTAPGEGAGALQLRPIPWAGLQIDDSQSSRGTLGDRDRKRYKTHMRVHTHMHIYPQVSESPHLASAEPKDGPRGLRAGEGTWPVPGGSQSCGPSFLVAGVIPARPPWGQHHAFSIHLLLDTWPWPQRSYHEPCCFNHHKGPTYANNHREGVSEAR